VILETAWTLDASSLDGIYMRGVALHVATAGGADLPPRRAGLRV
jgi:hypothetical protein